MLVPILIAGSLVLATSSNSESSTNWTYSRLTGNLVCAEKQCPATPLHVRLARDLRQIFVALSPPRSDGASEKEFRPPLGVR